MIVKNEAEHLARCLQSVRGIVDEMVIVDTGSTDRTVQIAEQCGARVFHFAWCHDFAAARNEALSHARGHWILALDADETLATSARRRLRALLRDARCQAYLLNIRSPVKGLRSQTAVINAWPRLFRNRPEIRYEGRVHEQISPSIARMGGTVAATDLVIDHLGYHQDFRDQMEKQGRNLALLEQALAENPDDAMMRFHLGEALGIGGRVAEAVDAYRKAIASPRLPKQNTAVAYRGLAGGLLRLRDYAGTVEACGAAMAADPGYPLPHFLSAVALSRLGRHAEAVEELKAYVRLSEQTKLAAERVLEHEADFGFALALQGDCLLTLGRRAEAEAAFREAIRRQPGAPEGHLGLGRIHSLRGEHREAVLHFEKARALFKELPRGHLALAEAHAAQRHWAEALAALEPFLAAEPGDPRGLALRAEALLHANRHGEAEEAFRHLLTVDPNPDAHLALACLADARGAQEDVLAHCAEARRLGGDDPRIFFLEGKAHVHRGNAAEAEARLLEALQRAPATPEIYEHLAALAFSRGEVARALGYFQRLLAVAPNHPVAARAIPVLQTALTAA
jgi:tetratricopeptide (TPR) repeat protein